MFRRLARRLGMRSLVAALLLAVAVPLAGCLEDGADGPRSSDGASGDPGLGAGAGRTYTLISVSGEVGAINATAPTAWCSTGEKTVQLVPDEQRVWLSDLVVNNVPEGGPLFVVSSLRQRASGDSPACDLVTEAYGSANGSFARTWLWSMDEEVRFELVDGVWQVDGQALPPLGRIDRPGGPGNDGRITLVNLGDWPVSGMRTVPYTWTECCPPVAPVVTPSPPLPPTPAEPATYVLLTIDGNVSRDPPVTTAPGPACGRTGHPFVRVDFTNATLHLVGGELRGHDFDRNRTQVVVYDRVDLSNNACGSRPALWGAEGAFQWSYPFRGGAFTAGIGRTHYRLDNETIDQLSVDSDRLRPGQSFTRDVAFESNGTRWSMTLKFTLHGPWLSRDVHEWPTEMAVPRVGSGASWHIDMPR